MLENPKFIKKPELFKFCEFKPELNEVVLFRTKLVRFGYFLLGVAVGIPLIMALFGFELREDKRLALVLGTLVQAVVFSLFAVPHMV